VGPRPTVGRGRPERTQRHFGAHRGDPGGRGGAIAAIVVDAGALYDYVDADDAHHQAALDLLQTHPGPLVVPTLVITEVASLPATRLGVAPEVRFLGDLAGGAFAVESVAAADWLRIAELVARYRTLPLGTVDASVVATAERLGVAEIATVDRRHFSVVRPAHVAAFTLLP
jgi:predicted nucleic acid-binding protein